MRPGAVAPAAKGRRPPLFWVPWAFVAAFVVVIAVNGVLIAFATRTFSGLVVEKPYLKGLAYEATLRQEEAQAALGWSTTTAYRAANREIAVRYLDKTGRALGDLQVVASIESPLRPESAVDVPLHYQGEGWYRAKVEFAHPGQREAAVTAAAGTRRHQLRFRFVVP
ncbi:FixH family protein [Desertibaculum subflavum]|uniref:FixH family protein n=1 Tax=Desertibaculum subflavum TaxID=2268458 RepID=UPI0013C437BD